MKTSLLSLAFASLFQLAIPAVEASTIRIDMLDAGRVSDISLDAIPDQLHDALTYSGALQILNGDELRAINEPSSLCHQFGCTLTYNDVALVEFLSFDTTQPISALDLKFSRFVTSAFTALGTLRVSAFLGDGVVDLSDFDKPSIILGDFAAPTSGRTDYVISALSLLGDPILSSGLAAGSVQLGVRFEVLGRGGAYLMDTAYSGKGEVLFASTPAPYLQVQYAVAAVPLPSAAGLLVFLGLAPLTLLGRMRARNQR